MRDCWKSLVAENILLNANSAISLIGSSSCNCGRIPVKKVREGLMLICEFFIDEISSSVSKAMLWALIKLSLTKVVCSGEVGAGVGVSVGAKGACSAVSVLAV